MSKHAFFFPGQGSQQLAMLSTFADNQIVTKTFAQASEILGFDLWALCQTGPEDKLNNTVNTQPALLTAGVALYRYWQEKSLLRPNFLAGHSLGEYTALTVAGSLDFADAVLLVKKRGEFMQSAVPAGGAMAAIIGLEAAQIAQVCAEVAGEQVVACANYNSPQQTVIAGHEDAVARAVAAVKGAGAKRAVMLAVSVPSHCALMQPAAEAMTEVLASTKIQAPAIPVLHNADVQLHNHPDDIRQALVQQLSQPVRWTESVQQLVAEGVGQAYECGPQNVLAGLCKRIDRSLNVSSLATAQTFTQALESVR